jgi:FixJ family two-component response regulator
MGLLTNAAFDTLACASMEEGVALTSVTDFSALVIDAAVAPPSVLDLRAIAHIRGEMPVLVMTADHSEIGIAVAALRGGYRDFVTPPFDERVIQALQVTTESAQ